MKESKGNWGILITRGQPFHKGHIDVIRQALSENDYVLVVIGSADKCGLDRNPLTIERRKYYFYKLRSWIKESDLRLQYLALDDWSSEKDIPYDSDFGSENKDFESVSSDWGMYLYYNIVTKIKSKRFTLYYNDDKSIIDSWFPKFIRDRITIKNSKRIDNFSSSMVRKALKDNDLSYLKVSLPYLNEEDIKELRKKVVEV